MTIAAAGGAVTLGRNEVTDPDAFPDGPPVFNTQDAKAHFLRPAAAGGDPAQVVAGGGARSRCAWSGLPGWR